MMGALAEFERGLIAERTRAGMKAAKRRGKHIGRPSKLTRRQIHHTRDLIASGKESSAACAELFKVEVKTLRWSLVN